MNPIHYGAVKFEDRWKLVGKGLRWGDYSTLDEALAAAERLADEIRGVGIDVHVDADAADFVGEAFGRRQGLVQGRIVAPAQALADQFPTVLELHRAVMDRVHGVPPPATPAVLDARGEQRSTGFESDN